MVSLEYLRRFRRNISVIGLFKTITDFKNINNLEKAEILYLCHDNSRSVYIDKKYYSPLIDTINIRLKNKKNLTLALPFSKYSGDKVYGNTVNVNFYIIIALIKRFFLKKQKDPLIVFYSKLLKKTGVKVIIGIQPSVEICIAADDLGIEVFDVQHGVIELENKLSYYSLSKRAKIHNQGWPNKILCRNELTYNKVNNLLSLHTKPLMIGNLNKIFYTDTYKEKQKNPFKNKNKIILFTFQPLYGKDYTNENKHGDVVFPNYLLKLIEKSNYNFILKLHPSQVKNKETYKKHLSFFKNSFLLSDRVDYITCNQKPLEYSLSLSDLHITYNSASLFDALDYKIKTILLDTDFSRVKNYFGDLLDTSNVKLVSNEEYFFKEKMFKDNLKKDEDKDSLHLSSFINYIKNIK